MKKKNLPEIKFDYLTVPIGKSELFFLFRQIRTVSKPLKRFNFLSVNWFGKYKNRNRNHSYQNRSVNLPKVLVR
jgi:hypothetical protein